jgi:hypothetical protein
MKKIYRDANGRPYMIKESYNPEEEVEDPRDERKNELGDINLIMAGIENLTDDNPDIYANKLEEDSYWDVNDIFVHFVSDFDESSIEHILARLSNITAKDVQNIMFKIGRNYRRLRKHTAVERYDILVDMIDDIRESKERSFNYDPDNEDFDELEFDKTGGDEFDNDVKPAKEQPVEIDDDVKNFTYALDQELKLPEQDRSHFYITLKNDPDTDYEVIVLGKQSNMKYIFNIFMDDDTTIKALSVSDIDLDATMVDSDSIW